MRSVFFMVERQTFVVFILVTGAIKNEWAQLLFTCFCFLVAYVRHTRKGIPLNHARKREAKPGAYIKCATCSGKFLSGGKRTQTNGVSITTNIVHPLTVSRTALTRRQKLPQTEHGAFKASLPTVRCSSPTRETRAGLFSAPRRVD